MANDFSDEYVSAGQPVTLSMGYLEGEAVEQGFKGDNSTAIGAGQRRQKLGGGAVFQLPACKVNVSALTRRRETAGMRGFEYRMADESLLSSFISKSLFAASIREGYEGGRGGEGGTRPMC